MSLFGLLAMLLLPHVFAIQDGSSPSGDEAKPDVDAKSGDSWHVAFFVIAILLILFALLFIFHQLCGEWVARVFKDSLFRGRSTSFLDAPSRRPRIVTEQVRYHKQSMSVAEPDEEAGTQANMPTNPFLAMPEEEEDDALPLPPQSLPLTVDTTRPAAPSVTLTTAAQSDDSLDADAIKEFLLDV